MWAGAPKQGHPLNDSVFVYREWLAPLGSSHKERAETVFAFERPDNETPRADLFSLNSHEAQGDRDTYRDYGLILRKWNVDYQDGIDEITDRFTLVDVDQPHPIRPQLMGRPKIYFVVADGEGELLRKASGEFHVTPAQSMLGLVNLRRQVQRYHYPPEEEGKPVGQMRPRKIDDDVVDVLRAFATHRWPRKPYMTEAEQKDAARPPGIRNADLAKVTNNEEASRIIMSQMFFDSEREKERRDREGHGRFPLPRVPRIRFRR